MVAMVTIASKVAINITIPIVMVAMVTIAYQWLPRLTFAIATITIASIAMEITIATILATRLHHGKGSGASFIMFKEMCIQVKTS